MDKFLQPYKLWKLTQEEIESLNVPTTSIDIELIKNFPHLQKRPCITEEF